MAEIKAEIEIIDGVDIEIKDNKITAKGKLGELIREFPAEKLKITKNDNTIILIVSSDKRKQRALLGTWRGHIQNMVNGVFEGFTYKLKIVYSHFPMTVKTQGDIILIENFLGERFPRKTKIIKNVSVDINGQEITVSGVDKESVSQTAANMEQVTRIRRLDPRVFQDGIYIIEKDGKEIN